MFDYIERFYNRVRRYSSIGCHSPENFERLKAEGRIITGGAVNNTVMFANQKNLRTCLFYLGTAVFVVIALWPNLSMRLGIVLDPYKIRADALQQNFAYWSFYGKDCMRNDYIANYYLNAMAPTGVKYLFASLSHFFSPIQIGTWLSLLLALIFVVLLTESARHLAGKMAGFLTAFCACAYLCRDFILAEAIPRSFGCLIAALGFYAIVRKKYLLLAVSACLGALFYPVAGAVLACSLGIMVCLPSAFCGTVWRYSLAQRALGLLALGLLLVLLVSPMLLGGRSYGQRISIKHQTEFPEAGLGGRYAPSDLGIYNTSLPVDILHSVSRVYLSKRESFPGFSSGKSVGTRTEKKKRDNSVQRKVVFWGFLIGALVRLIVCQYRRKTPIDFVWVGPGAFLLAIVLMYYLAEIFYPHLFIPSRYPIIGVPALALVVVPAIFANFSRSFCSPIAKCGAFLCVFGVLVGLSEALASRVPKKMSYEGNRSVYEFLKALPSNSLIAGWPIGIIDSVPYYSCKAALLTMETHQAFHSKYVLEMRTRTYALIDAFFDNSLASIKRLNTEFGVTHLILERRISPKHANYFAPFGDYINSKRFLVNGQWQEVFQTQSVRRSIVFRRGPIVILDLAKLP